MDWKNFLKPNKQKIIILIILSFLVPFPYVFFPVAYGIRPAIVFLSWAVMGCLNVYLLGYGIFYSLISLSINYLIACSLHKFIKFRYILLLLLGLAVVLSILPAYKDTDENGSSKSYTFIEQFTEPIKYKLQRKKVEKFRREGDIVKLEEILDEYFVKSSGYYIVDVRYRGIKSDFEIHTPMCTKNPSWIKEGACYKYKSEEEMEKDAKFNILPGGGDVIPQS